MTLNDSISDAQIATMQKLAADKVILKINHERVRALRDQVAQQRKEAAANLVQEAKLEAAAKAQTDQVTALVNTRSKAKQAAAALRREDARVYPQRWRERNKVGAQLRALARSSSPTVARALAVTAADPVMPVHGNPPITSPYGMRMHPITHVYKLHDGTDFGVPCGTPVHAAAGGRVFRSTTTTATATG